MRNVGQIRVHNRVLTVCRGNTWRDRSLPGTPGRKNPQSEKRYLEKMQRKERTVSILKERLDALCRRQISESAAGQAESKAHLPL